MEQINLINLKGVCFGYPQRPDLLSDLDFTLNFQERVGIIGPNGCGKTTLLYIIMGLIKPRRGEVEIFGKTRREEGDFKEVRKKIGFLFQNSDDQLFCPSVKEEVAFGPLNFGVNKEMVQKIVADTLARVGLSGFEPRTPYSLSGGEKRRLALATIFAMNPEVLLLDEPTIGLDEETVIRIKEILKSPGLSYIIVSQNRLFLKELTDIQYTINNGKIKRIE